MVYARLEGEADAPGRAVVPPRIPAKLSGAVCNPVRALQGLGWQCRGGCSPRISLALSGSPSRGPRVLIVLLDLAGQAVPGRKSLPSHCLHFSIKPIQHPLPSLQR